MSACDLAHQYLATAFRHEPQIQQLLQFNGQQHLTRTNRHSLLEYLCRAIAGQQLSTKAAATIWGRVKAQQKLSNRPFRKFLNHIELEQLRACGLSNAKAKTILGLALAQQQGLLNSRNLKQLSDQALLEHLCQFWGVGRWTAQMCAIGYFKMADIWSEGDVGLKNALAALYPNDDIAQMAAVENAQPFRSYWSLHLWSALDNGFFKPNP